MKRFIKNNLKVFVTLIISGIVFTGIGVYAASQYFAKDITFTPTNENFKKENGELIDNVEDALNELYSMTNNNIFTGFEYFEWKCQRSVKNTTAFYSSYTLESSNWNFSKSSTLPYLYSYKDVNIQYEKPNNYYKNIITANKKVLLIIYDNYNGNIIRKELHEGESYILDLTKYSTSQTYDIVGIIMGLV